MSKQPRSRRLEIRVTDSELAAIDAAAERAGMTRTAYLVASATGADVAPVVVDAEPLRQAARRWSGVATNVNTIAHAVNAGHVPADADLRAAIGDASAAAADAKDAALAMLAEARRAER